MFDVLIAFLIDLLVGDPYWFPHPVRFIGWLIKRTEKLLRGRIENIGYMGEEKARAERRS
ncbi:MAG TPA: cobalamin biosynthesis protein, partial [Clostridia bacterium]